MTTPERGDPGVEEAAFERRALEFLEAHAKPRRGARADGWGEGSDSVALLEEASHEEQRRQLDEIRRWKALEFDAGFGWISGPPEYGGAGLPRSFDRRYVKLKQRFDTPSESALGVSLGMVGAAILSHGTELLRERYLRRLHRVELVACQLFSEPGAGSDLASLQTRAVRDGDGWRVTGQKVWTSGAHYSDIGEVICLTDPDADRHRGITAFVVDMHAEGVDVRPLRQMNHGAAFNEVFLDDVWVPDDHRMGEVNGGWKVAIATLLHERASIAAGAASAGGAGFARVRQLAEWCGTTDDPIARQRLADLYIGLTVARLTGRRHAAEAARGRPSAASGSIAKLALVGNQHRISDLAGALLGPRLTADTGEWGTYAWADYVLSAPGVRIAGGTDEIQRNILAERGLGLPRG